MMDPAERDKPEAFEMKKAAAIIPRGMMAAALVWDPAMTDFRAFALSWAWRA